MVGGLCANRGRKGPTQEVTGQGRASPSSDRVASAPVRQLLSWRGPAAGGEENCRNRHPQDCNTYAHLAWRQGLTHHAGVRLANRHQAGVRLANRHQAGVRLAKSHHAGVRLANRHHTGMRLANRHQAGVRLANRHQAGVRLANRHQAGVRLANRHQAGVRLANRHHTGVRLANRHHAGTRLANRPVGVGSAQWESWDSRRRLPCWCSERPTLGRVCTLDAPDMDAPSSSGRKRLASLPTATIPSKKALKEANVLLISDSEAGEPSSSSAPAHASKGYSLAADDQEGVCSEVEIDPDLRCQVQEIVQGFRADIKQAIVARRRRIEKATEPVIKAASKKIDHIWVTQHEHRQNLHLKFSRQFLALFQEWDDDEKKFQEQEEKLVNDFHEQRKNLQQAVAIQNRTLKKMKALYEQFSKKLVKLEKEHEGCFTEHGEVKQQINEWKKNIVTQAQEQELGIIQKSLNSLLF
ncbi:uncharacterized protein LOC132535910 [Erinaceus europaeus]|uniref:Uncharacterized protein LOC132535910 n=1 Tax=Erinaceus europaeus TaxID=9365 RepID=A0ABM3WS80_ERIEU|nr:uncharacterized protein LOC132535910 [Erinaceus europaeus]